MSFECSSISQTLDFVAQVPFYIMFFVKILSLCVAFVVSQCAPSATDVSCLVEDLKEKGTLEADFPEWTYVDPTICQTQIEALSTLFEGGFYHQLEGKSSINARCVADEFKNNGGIDNFFVKHVLEFLKGLNEDVKKQKMRDTNTKLKNSFDDAAAKCNSDPTYAGLFGNILGFKNETIAALTENYCAAKFVVENNFISVPNVNLNPNKIATENLNCTAIISNKRKAEKEKVRYDNRYKDFSETQIDCVMKKYRSFKVFETALAIKILDRLDIPLDVKFENSQKVGKISQDFEYNTKSCFEK